MPVLGGIGLGLSYPPWNCTLLVWVSLVPVALLLRTEVRPFLACVSAFATGLSFSTLALDWMRTCYAPTVLIGPLFVTWAATSEYLAVGFVLSAFGGRWLARHTTLPMMVLLPAWWVGTEYLWHLMGTLVAAQPCPWLHVGLPLADNLHLAQIADVGGVWLVSGLIACVNGALFDCVAGIVGRARGATLTTASLGALGAAAVWTCAWLYGEHRLASDGSDVGPRIALAPASAAPQWSAMSSRPSKATCLPKDCPDPHCVDIVLFPELSCGASFVIGDDADVDETMLKFSCVPLATAERGLRAIADDTRCPILLGASRVVVAQGREEHFNSLFCIQPGSGITGIYDKMNLVPFRESRPNTVLGRFLSSDGSLTPGAARMMFRVTDRVGRRYGIAASICYDVAFPDHFDQHAWDTQEAAPVSFFVCASHEPPNRGNALQQILLLMARYRAIESRRAIVRNVTNGYSGVIDSRGRFDESAAAQRLPDEIATVVTPICRESVQHRQIGQLIFSAMAAAVVVGSIAHWNRLSRAHVGG